MPFPQKPANSHSNGVLTAFGLQSPFSFAFLFDCWDADRDARRYVGPWPVIAHPPCRGWGSLRQFAKPRPDELELAFFAVDFVRMFGGVLEHPQGSLLWRVAGLPRPGEPADSFGGFTVLVDQGWFGHFAPKPTWIYCVGMPRHHFPPMPVDDLRRRTGRTVDMLPADRERTPWLLASFLVGAAARCYVAPGRAVTRLDRALLPGSGCLDLVHAVTPSSGGLLPVPRLDGYGDLVRAVTPGQGVQLLGGASCG